MSAIRTTLLSLVCSASVAAQPMEPKRITVHGTELHYIEQGEGEPLILLHGGQGDYRAWSPHMTPLAAHFRVISYSRRYHYPNQNVITPNYSALVDADDLAGLIAALKLGSVHLVGTSYGAFTALALAMARPDLVRTMVLAEAPILSWAAENPSTSQMYRDFMAGTHETAAKYFAAGDDTSAVRAFIDAFDGPGSFDALPVERRATILQNIGYFKAITGATAPYPNLSKTAVRRVNVPTLVVRGERTHEMDIWIAEELARVLPHAKTAVIPNAGHGSPRQNPRAFLSEVLAFHGIRDDAR